MDYNEKETKMKTILFWKWVYNCWRIRNAFGMNDWSLKDIYYACKEMSWMLDVAVLKVEAQ